MHFAFICIDKPDHGQVRADNRPAHLDYLKANAARMLAAGPLLSDDGERPRRKVQAVGPRDHENVHISCWRKD